VKTFNWRYSLRLQPPTPIADTFSPVLPNVR
jgi:hypothetical protein